MMAPPEASSSSDALNGVEELVEAVDAAHSVLRAISEHTLEELGGGLTTTQLRLLAQLQRLGASRLVDLAEAMVIAPSTATRLCDTLAERQLIVRHRRGRDRRELQIRLTDTGTRLLDVVRTRNVREWSRALDSIGEGDRGCMARVLSHVSAIFDPVVPTAEAPRDPTAEAPRVPTAEAPRGPTALRP